METLSYIDLFSNVGFPIAAAAVLLIYVIKENNRNSQQLRDLTNAINENTKCLIELSTIIKTAFQK